MKKTTGYVSVMFLALSLIACGDGGSGAYKKLKSGMEYKIIGEGKGDVIKYGEVMKFHMAQKYKDSVMRDSYSQPPQYQPIDSMQLPNKEYLEIFSKVRKGDSIVIRMLTDSIFRQGMGTMPKEFKKGEYLVTTVKVLGIVGKDKAQDDFAQEVKKFQEQDSIRSIGQKVRDDEAIQAYLAKNNIKAERTEAGTYYEIQQAGGELVKEGQAISVKYTGKLLDGTVFDSNVDSSFHHTEPYTFTIGAGGSIKGFDDGLRKFGKGAKGRIFMPSGLAYGSQGQGKLKPNSNLLFEVEVLDIKDAPAAPTMPVKPQVTPVKPLPKAPQKKN